MPELTETRQRLSGPTATLADFVTRARPAPGPEHRIAVERVLVDTVGVAAIGLQTDVLEHLLGWLASEGLLDRAEGGAAVWSTERRVAPSIAALVNGTAAHALDWDDAAPLMPMHPGTVLMPALLAMADDAPVGADRLVHAYSVGSAVFRALAEALPSEVHYGRGWHTTSTVGRLAATCALSVLLDLTAGQVRNALGVAASSAAGTRANFGTMTKSLHAGLAARDAVVAVGLARTGFTANTAVLEGPAGFFALYGASPDTDDGRMARDSHDADQWAERLVVWENAWVRDYAIKRYPSCYATHRAIDAILALRDAVGTDDTVIGIDVQVEPTGLRPLRTELPTTGLEAKFSLPYTVATALVRGRVGLADFEPDLVGAADVADLMGRITVGEGASVMNRGSASPEPVAEVTVLTREGRTLTTRVTHSRGDARNPLDDAEIAEKFAECVGLPRQWSDRWIDSLREFARAADLAGKQSVLAGPNPRP